MYAATLYKPNQAPQPLSRAQVASLKISSAKKDALRASDREKVGEFLGVKRLAVEVLMSNATAIMYSADTYPTQEPRNSPEAARHSCRLFCLSELYGTVLIIEKV